MAKQPHSDGTSLCSMQLDHIAGIWGHFSSGFLCRSCFDILGRSCSEFMEDKLESGKLCRGCEESQNLELQGRRIMELWDGGGSIKHRGDHLNGDSELMGFKTSSKKPRYGRYVSQNGSYASNTTEATMAIDENLNGAKAFWVEAKLGDEEARLGEEVVASWVVDLKPSEDEDSSLIPGFVDSCSLEAELIDEEEEDDSSLISGTIDEVEDCSLESEATKQQDSSSIWRPMDEVAAVPSVLQSKHGEEEDSSLIPGLGDDVARLCLARLARSYFGSYYTVSKRFCELFKSGELYKTRRSLGICEQWAYMLISGQLIWRAFSLVDGGRWRELPQTPADPCFVISDKESFTAGTQLLVVGREVAGPVIWGYNLVTNQWFRAPQMITPRCLYGSASAGVHAFVAGGVATSKHQIDPSRAAERYDSLTGKWEALPDMIKARRMCSGAFMDGKFYVIGGTDGKDDLTCGEEYDPETRSWRVIPNMAPRRSSSTDHAPPLVAVVDNQLYSLDTSARQLKLYCKSNNTWTVIADGDVPVKAELGSGWGVAFKALDGELLLINGDALYAWKPAPGPVQWRYVAGLVDPFVFNCAVMSA